MTTTGTGIFYDGITSNRREVAVEIAGNAIEARGPGGCLKERWHFADMPPLATPAGILRIDPRALGAILLRISGEAVAPHFLVGHPQAQERAAAIAKIAPPPQMSALLTAPEWEALKSICTEGSP
jgi:hypothetical protein